MDDQNHGGGAEQQRCNEMVAKKVTEPAMQMNRVDRKDGERHDGKIAK